MNEFNVLLGAATNGTPSGSLFDALFARYIAPQESWRELESPLPITILSAGKDLIDYRIYGNTENGESVGERTENLCDDNAPDYEVGCFYDQNNTKYFNNAYAESGYIPVKAGTYSIVTTVSVTGRVLIANFFDTNKNFDSNLKNVINPPHVSTLTIPSDGYVRFNIALGTAYTNVFMFIEGSTAPTSYIPYGYKLPMTVNNGITNIVPPTHAETKVSKGITITSDGNGAYMISGTATSDTFITFFFDHPISCGTTNTIAFFNDFVSPNVTIGFYGQDGVFGLWSLNRVLYNTSLVVDRNLTGVILTVKANTTIKGNISPLIFDGANITPTEFVPHVPPISYDVPIYIGSDPLAEDEYVDFGEQKVYKRTVNMFDANGTENYGYYSGGSGQYVNNKNYKHWRFPVKEGDIVRWTYYGAGTGCLFYKGNYVTHFYSNASPLTIPSGVDEITNNYTSGAIPVAMVTKNQPIPSSYAPYYDPQDPPVPIPALPTTKGETIIDYNPSETPAVEPEKMYVKYKPQ